LIDPNAGDARFVVSNILDDKINTKTPTYEQLENILANHYKPQNEVSLYDAARHIFTVAHKIPGTSDQMQLININKAVQSFIEVVTQRPVFADNLKTTEESMKEALLLLLMSNWGGRKVSDKILANLPANKLPRDINCLVMDFNRRQ